MTWPPLASLAGDLRAGRLTAVDLADRALAAIDAGDPVVNAFVAVDPAGVRAQARTADERLRAGDDRGPLHGIPIAVKDVIDTHDLPTTMGAAHFLGHRPAEDAECVRRLRAAGAVIVGKTTTHQYAFGPTGDRSVQGATANPRDPTRMSGGSSAGSAAAVAAGMVPVALGTDTGGSVRIPAALCGVVGFKPSWGAVPLDGVFPLAPSLDTVGVLCAHARDVAPVFGVLAAGAPVVPSRRPRVAWLLPEPFLDAVDARVVDAIRRAAEDRFGPLPRVDLGPEVPRFRSAVAAVQRSEAYDVHAERIAAEPGGYEPEVLERLRVAGETRGWALVRALRDRAALRTVLATLFERYDLLALPGVAVVAPPLQARALVLGGREVAVRDTLLGLTNPWNLLGLPAIALPAGTVDGLPVGLQLVGPTDGAVLAAAS